MMALFQHIVVAYDKFDHSGEALLLGNQLANQLNAKLTIVHVHSPSLDEVVAEATPRMHMGGYVADGTPVPPPTAFEHQEKPIRLDQLKQNIVAEIQQFIPVTDQMTIEVVEGEPEKLLPKLAESLQADLIITGKRNASLKKLLFGSISEKMAKATDTPVLVAK